MAKAKRRGRRLKPAPRNGGDDDGRVWHVPKVDLMAGVQAALEREELDISKRMREAVALACWAGENGEGGLV